MPWQNPSFSQSSASKIAISTKRKKVAAAHIWITRTRIYQNSIGKRDGPLHYVVHSIKNLSVSVSLDIPTNYVGIIVHHRRVDFKKDTEMRQVFLT